jgi:hypothetical protein
MSLITGRSKNYIAVEAYRGLELLKKMYGKSNKKQQA